mmetsp:Transcript_2218/g.4994  ORF Transcript_2218/g.4994 Transcript_2218/m.4994 type:complete len:363 (-) Transcript_2218:2665-3753(-)
MITKRCGWTHPGSSTNFMVAWRPLTRSQVINQTNKVLRRTEARTCEQTTALTSQLHNTTSENQSLKQTVALAHRRIHDLERVIGFRKQDASPVCEKEYDTASTWKRDTDLDWQKYEDIAGHAFVATRDNVSVDTVSQVLGTDKPIVPCNKNNNMFRIPLANKGRAGASVVKSFLQFTKQKAPQNWKVQRERTQLTMQRERSLNDINVAIQKVISAQPKFAGLNTYVGVNGSTIYLSYGDRRDALNPQKKDTPAFKYPVWEHFEYDPLLNMGNGGINYKKTTNLESPFIEANIARSIPVTTCIRGSDDHMQDATHNTGLLDPAVETERLQRLHVGLTQLLFHFFNIFAKQHGNISETSRVLMR